MLQKEAEQLYNEALRFHGSNAAKPLTCLGEIVVASVLQMFRVGSHLEVKIVSTASV